MISVGVEQARLYSYNLVKYIFRGIMSFYYLIK